MDPRALVRDLDLRRLAHRLTDPTPQVDLGVEDVVLLVPVQAVR